MEWASARPIWVLFAGGSPSETNRETNREINREINSIAL
jgi:hypothetical protein